MSSRRKYELKDLLRQPASLLMRTSRQCSTSGTCPAHFDWWLHPRPHPLVQTGSQSPPYTPPTTHPDCCRRPSKRKWNYSTELEHKRNTEFSENLSVWQPTCVSNNYGVPRKIRKINNLLEHLSLKYSPNTHFWILEIRKISEIEVRNSKWPWNFHLALATFRHKSVWCCCSCLLWGSASLILGSASLILDKYRLEGGES